jgi:hypothetical protein
MDFCKSYCLTHNKCRTRIVSDKDIKKMITELKSGYLQYIRKKALTLLSIKLKPIPS